MICSTTRYNPSRLDLILLAFLIQLASKRDNYLSDLPEKVIFVFRKQDILDIFT